MRINHLPKKEIITVLDCYAGKGNIWRYIGTKHKIDVVSIDVHKKTKGLYLRGDNRKYLKVLQLNNFDIIDLDSYGVPYEQFKILANRSYRGFVFITFIQSVLRTLPKKMLYELGYTKDMLDKVRAPFNKNGLQKFKAMLSLNKVNEIHIRSAGHRHYIYFDMGQIKH